MLVVLSVQEYCKIASQLQNFKDKKGNDK